MKYRQLLFLKGTWGSVTQIDKTIEEAIVLASAASSLREARRTEHLFCIRRPHHHPREVASRTWFERRLVFAIKLAKFFLIANGGIC